MYALVGYYYTTMAGLSEIGKHAVIPFSDDIGAFTISVYQTLFSLPPLSVWYQARLNYMYVHVHVCVCVGIHPIA